jgi:hypothetical protein
MNLRQGLQAAGTMTANRQVGLFYLGIVVVVAALLAMPFQAASQTICKPKQYDCHDYKADVDMCYDGRILLRGTNILFRCDSGD